MCYYHLLLTRLSKVLAMILTKGRILCLPLQYTEVYLGILLSESGI